MMITKLKTKKKHESKNAVKKYNQNFHVKIQLYRYIN